MLVFVSVLLFILLLGMSLECTETFGQSHGNYGNAPFFCRMLTCLSVLWVAFRTMALRCIQSLGNLFNCFSRVQAILQSCKVFLELTLLQHEARRCALQNSKEDGNRELQTLVRGPTVLPSSGLTSWLW